MGKEVSVGERTDRERTYRERTDMARTDRERMDREISSGGTIMQTRVLHRYAGTTEARDHQGPASPDSGTLEDCAPICAHC